MFTIQVLAEGEWAMWQGMRSLRSDPPVPMEFRTEGMAIEYAKSVIADRGGRWHPNFGESRVLENGKPIHHYRFMPARIDELEMEQPQ